MLTVAVVVIAACVAVYLIKGQQEEAEVRGIGLGRFAEMLINHFRSEGVLDRAALKKAAGYASACALPTRLGKSAVMT